MLINTFLRKHQFTEHPFSKLAAEKEELLQLYFVQPRYFGEALGDARDPKSYVVFGPRGGGKSAIRSMIERYCADPKAEQDIGGRVLSITYDDFSALNLRQLSTITLSDHINEILKRGVPRLAAALIDQGKVGDDLQPQMRGVLRWFVDEFMSNLSKLELDSVLKMLRSQSDKIKELITDVAQIYNTVVSVLKLEEVKPDSPVDIAAKAKRDAISSIHIMDVFCRLSVELGFTAVYVLIDKVDEMEETGGNSDKAKRLVAPVLGSIKLLELDKCAFKLFLWDKVRGHFGSELREDRIPMKTTEWTKAELEKMLEKRVRAYSLGRTTLKELFVPEIRDRVVPLLINLAYKSPRDLSRLMEAIFFEAAIDATDDEYLITWAAVVGGIQRFSAQRSGELYAPETIERLQKLNKTTFMIADVSATFKITGDSEIVPDRTATNRARNVVEKWKNEDVIEQLEPVLVRDKNGRNRSANQYKVLDPRVAYLINPTRFLEESAELVGARN